MIVLKQALQTSLLIGLGGFAGANARYWLGMAVTQRLGAAFPFATFLINITGSFLIGLLLVVLTTRISGAQRESLRLLLAVGFIGAYTTFSTFEYETLSLANEGQISRAFLNAMGSLILGFVAVAGGEAAGRWLTR